MSVTPFVSMESICRKYLDVRIAPRENVLHKVVGYCLQSAHVRKVWAEFFQLMIPAVRGKEILYFVVRLWTNVHLQRSGLTYVHPCYFTIHSRSLHSLSSSLGTLALVGRETQCCIEIAEQKGHCFRPCASALRNMPLMGLVKIPLLGGSQRLPFWTQLTMYNKPNK